MARKLTSLLMTALVISIFLNLTFYMSLIQRINVPTDVVEDNFTLEEAGGAEQTKYGEIMRDIAAEQVDTLVKFGKSVHNSTVNKVGDILQHNLMWASNFSTDRLYDLLLSSRVSRNTTFNKIYDLYGQFKAMVSPEGSIDEATDNQIKEKFIEVMQNFTMIEADDEELDSVPESDYNEEGRSSNLLDGDVESINGGSDGKFDEDMDIFEDLGIEEDVRGAFEQFEVYDHDAVSTTTNDGVRDFQYFEDIGVDGDARRAEDDEGDPVTLATHLMNKSDAYMAEKLQVSQVQFPAPLLPHADFPIDITKAWNVTRVMYNCVDRSGAKTLLTLIGILSFEHGFRSVFNRIKRYNLTQQREEIAVKSVANRLPPYVFTRHVHYLDFEHHRVQPHAYINLIREPLPRFLTWYYSIKPDDLNESKYRLHPYMEHNYRMNFDECVLSNHPACTEENAFQVIPFFCGQAPECRIPSRWALEKAKRRVVQDYVFVGILEQFEDSLQIFEILMPQFFESAVKVYRTMVLGLKKYEYYKSIRAPLPSKLAVQEMSKRLSLEYEFFNFVRARMEILKKQILVKQSNQFSMKVY